jgi:hypothetical protein
MKKSTEDDYLKNIDAPTLEVNHADLERWSDESAFKSACPVCPEGILLVCRDDATFEILELDYCIVCGQRVRYLDIDRFKEVEA